MRKYKKLMITLIAIEYVALQGMNPQTKKPLQIRTLTEFKADQKIKGDVSCYDFLKNNDLLEHVPDVVTLSTVFTCEAEWVEQEKKDLFKEFEETMQIIEDDSHPVDNHELPRIIDTTPPSTGLFSTVWTYFKRT